MNRRFVNYKILVCLILSVAVATGFGFSQAASDLVDRMGYADIVLLDGKIVTMDDRSIVPNTPAVSYTHLTLPTKA